MLNDICLGGCGNERRATLSAKTITCVGARTENWQRAAVIDMADAGIFTFLGDNGDTA
jgi:hypothetical protein